MHLGVTPTNGRGILLTCLFLFRFPQGKRAASAKMKICSKNSGDYALEQRPEEYLNNLRTLDPVLLGRQVQLLHHHNQLCHRFSTHFCHDPTAMNLDRVLNDTKLIGRLLVELATHDE